MNGLVIYLDTTVLYRLLNLQGEKRYESIKKLINYCKEAQIKLKGKRKIIIAVDNFKAPNRTL